MNWEITAYIVLVIAFPIAWMRVSRSEKKAQQQQHARLKDDKLYDPETGAQFSMEEAEEGVSIRPDHNRIREARELRLYFDGSERATEEIANYLKAQEFEFKKLDEGQTAVLEQTAILSKYADWEYSNSFLFGGRNLVFFPRISINGMGRRNPGFSGNQIMFWIKTKNYSGHYYLREKEVSERIFDLLRNDDDFDIPGMEVFTIRKSQTLLPITSLLKNFSNEKNIEIEINGDNFYLKTLDTPSMEEYLRLYEKIREIC